MTISPYEAPANGEVVHYQQQGRSVSTLREWAEAARAAHQVAQSLVRTSFVPAAYRGKPDEATAAILAGDEIGLSPIAALNAFSVIQGRAAPNALTLRAVVQSRGHTIEKVESSPHRCIMRGRRAGSERWETVTWTIQRAQQLKLTSREQWRLQPENMLIARATSEIARLIAADAILGIPYSAEELIDEVDQPAASSTRSTRTRRQTPAAPAAVPPARTAAERPAQAGLPPLPGEPEYGDGDDPGADPVADSNSDAEPELVDTVDDVDEAADVDEAVDAEVEPEAEPAAPVDKTKLMKRVFAMLKDADVGDRHLFASGVLHKEVTTYGDLSAAELQALADNLQDIIEDR